MKTYTVLISRYLRHQKNRTLLMTGGMMLSIALMTYMFLFMDNLKELQLKASEQVYGTYHLKLSEVSEADEAQLRVLPFAKQILKMWTVPVALDGKQQSGIVVTALESVTAEGQSMLPIVYLMGRAPAAPNEIALTEWALGGLGLETQLGQTIEYAGFNFILTGVIGDQGLARVNNRAVGVVTPADIDHLALQGQEKETSFYIQYKGSFPRISDYYERTAELREQIRVDSGKLNHNDELLEALEQYHNMDVPSMTVVLITILATIAAIYNMFYISVIEKMKQYGTLRALGMSAKQLRRVVFGEAAVLSVLAIPLGLLLGCAALHLSGSFLLPEGAEKLHLGWQYLAAAAMIGFIVTVLAAWRPAIMAGRISPLESLRISTADNIFSSVIVSGGRQRLARQFGLSGYLAVTNLSRNKMRFVSTVSTLGLAVVLFIGVHYFVSVQDPAASLRGQYPWQSDYALLAGSNREGRGFDEKALASIRQLEGVRSVIPVQYSYGYTSVGYEKLGAGAIQLLEAEQEDWGNPYSQQNRLTSLVKYYFYSEEVLEEAADYVAAGRINMDALRSGNEVLWIQGSDSLDITLHVGESIAIGHTQLVDGPKDDNWQFDSSTRTVKIGAILRGFPVIGQFPLHFVGHSQTYEAFSGSTLYRKINIRIDNGASRPEVEEALQQIAKASRGQLNSFEEQRRELTREFQQITQMLVAFIAIITVIGGLSIFNTMMTHLLLRTKEFGVMRAVGMSVGQLRRMIWVESAVYGLCSGFLGSVLGTASTYLLYLYFTDELPSMIPRWQFPGTSILYAFVGTFLIVWLASFLPTQRLSKLSIVDSIRFTE